jgi:hypothetical protein
MNLVLVMVMVMGLPLVVMMVMVLPMAVVMGVTVRLPIDVVHVGCQLAGVTLSDRNSGAERIRLRLLRGSRDNQKRAESGQS